MNSIICLTFIAFYTSYFHLVFGLFREIYPERILLPINGDPGKPLFLTPLIKAGKISEARNSSTVPELLPGVKSNSGFLTVNETYNSNLFFWFFPKSANDWKNAALLLWLQGGPGSSSLFGLFTENGPFEFKKSILKKRKYSWSNEYNILFIDNPVGTGFSFTENENGYARNQDNMADCLYSALEQFFRLYPELKNNSFFITGESYAGKYIPAIASKIHKQNSVSSSRINMQGLFIGNGFCDPINMLEYGKYLRYIGLINRYQEVQFASIQETVKLLIKSSKWQKASSTMDRLIGDSGSLFENFTGFPLYYDYTRERSGADDKYANTFIQSAQTRKAIHVGSLTYNDGLTVYKYLFDDILKTVKPLVEDLLEHYRIMFYSGQLDIIVAYPLSENFFRKLEWSGASNYASAARQKWYVGGHLAGYYKRSGNFADVLVRNAGHMVPTYQPKWAFHLLKAFVSGTM